MVAVITFVDIVIKLMGKAHPLLPGLAFISPWVMDLTKPPAPEEESSSRLLPPDHLLALACPLPVPGPALTPF